MGLYTIRLHTSYYCGQKSDGTPAFNTSSKTSRRLGWNPVLFTSKRAASRTKTSLRSQILQVGQTRPSLCGHTLKISNVRTVNRVLG